MRKLIALALALSLAAFMAPVNSVLVAQTVNQDPTKGFLQGTAKTGMGIAKEGTTVQLVDAAGNVVASTTTNAQGIFQFANLNPGQFTVQLLDAGKLVGIAGNVTVTAGVITTATVTGVTAAVAAVGIIIPTVTTALVVGAVTLAGTTIALAATATEASPSR
jgi:hypothetical protein